MAVREGGEGDERSKPGRQQLLAMAWHFRRGTRKWTFMCVHYYVECESGRASELQEVYMSTRSNPESGGRLERTAGQNQTLVRHARVEFARLSRRRYPYLIGVIPRGYISRRFLSNMSLRVVTRCQLPLRCSVSSRHPHPLPRLQPLRDLFSSPTSLSCYVSHLPYLDQFSVSTLLRRALADQHTLSRIQVSLPELGPWKHACLWRLDNHRKDGTRSLRR